MSFRARSEQLWFIISIAQPHGAVPGRCYALSTQDSALIGERVLPSYTPWSLVFVVGRISDTSHLSRQVNRSRRFVMRFSRHLLLGALVVLIGSVWSVSAQAPYRLSEKEMKELLSR